MGCASLDAERLIKQVNDWTRSFEEALAKRGIIRSMTELESLTQPLGFPEILKNRAAHLTRALQLEADLNKERAAWMESGRSDEVLHNDYVTGRRHAAPLGVDFVFQICERPETARITEYEKWFQLREDQDPVTGTTLKYVVWAPIGAGVTTTEQSLQARENELRGQPRVLSWARAPSTG